MNSRTSKGPASVPVPRRRAVAARRAHPFDPAFAERDPRFWPLLPARSALGPLTAFPSLEALGRLLPAGPVRFVLAEPRKRGMPIEPSRLYDARITLEGAVPTRLGCWHDLMNALVWGTFPNAKRALHARQHRAIEARLEPGARSLPPNRTRELDALALFDEGGVVLVSRAGDEDAVRAALRSSDEASPRALPAGTRAVLFGHALYESLAIGFPPAVVAALVVSLEQPSIEGGHHEAERGAVARDICLTGIDAALVAVIRDPLRFRAPAELARLDLAAALPPSSRSGVG